MPPASWPRAILFDAAGTLIELRESVGASYSRVAGEYGVALPAWRLDDAFRRVLAGAPPRAFPEAPPEGIEGLEREWWQARVRETFLAADSTIRFDDFASFFEQLFAEYSGDTLWRAKPFAAELLAQLNRSGARIGVISNFDKRLPEILQELKLADFLETITLPADCGAEKPDARIFLAALRDLDLPPEACVYVGDDPERDLAGAQAAGLAVLDVSQLDSLRELPARLQSLATLGFRPDRDPRSSDR